MKWTVEENALLGDQGLVVDGRRNVALCYDKQDAALIAAAPEMYEALKGIIAALSQNKTYPADIDAAKSFARAALAKAKGGENGNNN